MTRGIDRTSARVRRLEREWAEACAAQIRAERAYQLLVSGDGEDATASSAAWLVLWRTEQRKRETELELEQLRAEMPTAA